MNERRSGPSTDPLGHPQFFSYEQIAVYLGQQSAFVYLNTEAQLNILSTKSFTIPH